MGANGPQGSRDWYPVDAGAATVAVAERAALGTTARVVVWPPGRAGRALVAVDAELGSLDEQASRFRDDSEISRIHGCLAGAAGGAWCAKEPVAAATPAMRRAAVQMEAWRTRRTPAARAPRRSLAPRE